MSEKTKDKIVSENKDEDKTLLGELNYRLFNLRVRSIGYRVLQFLVTSFCAAYVFNNSESTKKLLDIFNIGDYVFTFNGDYWSYLCLILSVALAIPWPANAREKINIIRPAIKAIGSGGRSTWEKNIINRAKVLITDVDRAHQKKKEGRDNEIVPHERRMVMRRNLKIYGIPAFILLTIIQIFFNWNFPYIVACDLIVGYIMVIYDSLYYQLQLKNYEVAVMTGEHRKRIKAEQDTGQHFKLLQKIYHMEADRYTNYGQVLGVASSVLNILAILLTLLDATGNDEWINFFMLNTKDVNADISSLFMCISIVFLFLDMYIQSYIGRKVVILQAQESMEYFADKEESMENYKFLLARRNEKNFGANTLLHNIFGESIAGVILMPFRPLNTIFSRNALDIGRGRYDFNNDALVRDKYEYKNRASENDEYKIPAECMSSVADSFPGRVPRFKFSAFVVWVVLICVLVWGREDINGIISGSNFLSVNYLLSISLIVFILYDMIIIFFASRTWNKLRQWILFEKTMEEQANIKLSREVKWDFFSYFLGHSIIIVLLACGYAWWNERSMQYTILLGFAVFSIIIGVVGYRLAKKARKFVVPEELYEFGAVFVLVIGILCCWSAGEWDLFKLFFMAVVIPAFIVMFSSYLRRVRAGSGAHSVEMPKCAVFLLANWVSTIILLNFSGKLQGNLLNAGFTWMYTVVVVLFVSGIAWEVKQIYDMNKVT